MASTPPSAGTRETEPVTRSHAASRTLPPLVVLVVGLLITAALAWICWTVNDRNETRLLRVQVQQAGAVISAVVPSIEAPLASGVDIADATGGDPGKFSAYMSPHVGPAGVYASVTLVAVGPPARAVTVLGKPPYVTVSSGQFARTLAASERSGTPGVIGILGTADRRVGYVDAAPGSSFAVYAETALPPEEHFTVAPTDAFSDLDFAIYLGHVPATSQLLGASSLSGLPLTGRTASTFVPVGDSGLLIVARPASELGGSLLNDLTWIVALAGVALTLVAAWIARRLVRGRDLAERLAVLNHALYGEQRGIAQTLQRALLPDVMPPVRGLETAVRYRPGVEGIDVGGDWCDVVELGSGRLVFVVGDVFGRGLEAATTMAALHYSVRAYAREGSSPSVILDRLSELVRGEPNRRFASVLCGAVDTASHGLTLANAGHLPPLLVTPTGRSFVEAVPGPPLGVEPTATYRELQLEVRAGSTLVAFTDGLVERRNEVIDVGLARLRDAFLPPPASLDECLDGLVAALVLPDATDDTALLGLRWTA